MLKRLVRCGDNTPYVRGPCDVQRSALFQVSRKGTTEIEKQGPKERTPPILLKQISPNTTLVLVSLGRGGGSNQLRMRDLVRPA